MRDPIWSDESCIIHANGITWLEVYKEGHRSQEVQGFDVFEVTLYSDLVGKLLERMDMVRKVSEHHNDLVMMVFEDHSNGKFWHGHCSNDEAPPTPQKLTELGQLLPSGLTSIPTRIYVGPSTVSWKTRTRDTNVLVMTEPLTYAQLTTAFGRLTQSNGNAA